MTTRILIKGGKVHRGDRFIGTQNILIEDDRVTSIGNLKDAVVDEVIDASGCVVSPGFIDVQNMTYKLEQLDGNDAVNLTSQGVTSCIIGNCGNSGDLCSQDSFLRRIDYLRKARLGINVGSLVGHNSLRKLVLSEGERVATSGEIGQIVSILNEALEYGAMGMSSGLMYSPGLFADDREMTALVSTIGKHNKVYTTHMRDEGDHLIEAVNEAIDTAGNGGARLLISHFKVTGKNNWGKSGKAINLIEQRGKSQEIYLDFYPYSATSTVLSIIMPKEIRKRIGNDFSRLQYNLNDERLIEKKGKQNLCLNTWDDVVVVTSKIPGIIGKSIASISEESSYKAIVEILRQDSETRVVFHNIASEEELYTISKLPYAIPATDGYIYPENSREATHPRNYGSFPRVLSKSLFSLEEFIQKATNLPATVFNIKRRGMLEKDYFADVIIFDPKKVKDRASYDYPYLLSDGIQYVFVNGQLVFKKNCSAKAFPGRLIT